MNERSSAATSTRSGGAGGSAGWCAPSPSPGDRPGCARGPGALDVDAVHVLGAALEHAVGEPARAQAAVEGDGAADVDVERVERPPSFNPAAHELGLRGDDVHDDVGRTFVPAFVTGWPFTRTLPCAIQLCTTVRECSGWRSIVSSSRRRFPPAAFPGTGAAGPRGGGGGAEEAEEAVLADEKRARGRRVARATRRDASVAARMPLERDRCDAAAAFWRVREGESGGRGARRHRGRAHFWGPSFRLRDSSSAAARRPRGAKSRRRRPAKSARASGFGQSPVARRPTPRPDVVARRLRARRARGRSRALPARARPPRRRASPRASPAAPPPRATAAPPPSPASRRRARNRGS